MEHPIDNATGQPIIPIRTPEAPVVSTLPTKLELWCKAAIMMEGANPANHNPGNIRFAPNTWMEKIAIGQNHGFCIFPTYAVGYNVLRQIFINAATGKSKIYHPNDTLYQFYAKYAPNSDGNDSKHYAEVVASVIGVSPNTMIKTLV